MKNSRIVRALTIVAWRIGEPAGGCLAWGVLVSAGLGFACVLAGWAGVVFSYEFRAGVCDG